MRITLKRKVGKKWKSAGSKTVAVSGATFSYSFKPKYKGSWKMTATYAGGTYGIDRYLSSNTTKRPFAFLTSWLISDPGPVNTEERSCTREP